MEQQPYGMPAVAGPGWEQGRGTGAGGAVEERQQFATAQGQPSAVTPQGGLLGLSVTGPTNPHGSERWTEGSALALCVMPEPQVQADGLEPCPPDYVSDFGDQSTQDYGEEYLPLVPVQAQEDWEMDGQSPRGVQHPTTPVHAWGPVAQVYDSSADAYYDSGADVHRVMECVGQVDAQVQDLEERLNVVGTTAATAISRVEQLATLQVSGLAVELKKFSEHAGELSQKHATFENCLHWLEQTCARQAEGMTAQFEAASEQVTSLTNRVSQLEAHSPPGLKFRAC